MIMRLETELAVKEASIDGTMLVTPEHVESYLCDIKALAQEVFVVITLNAKNRVIQKHLVSIGTVNSALVHPRECYRTAILDGASALILAHNHPLCGATHNGCYAELIIMLSKPPSTEGGRCVSHYLLRIIIGCPGTPGPCQGACSAPCFPAVPAACRGRFASSEDPPRYKCA
jgi:hypothetical protein